MQRISRELDGLHKLRGDEFIVKVYHAFEKSNVLTSTFSIG